MTARSNRTRLLGALVLAAACALVWSGAAAAQQSETPNELWQEYPLDPAPGSPEPAEEAPQAPSSRGGGEQVGGGGGDEEGAAAAEEEPFPLVQVALALGLLVLGILHGVLVLARRSGVSERLGERIGAVRSPPPSPRRPAYAARRSPTGSLARRTEPRPKRPPPAAGAGEGAEVAEVRAEVAEEPAEVAEKPTEVTAERAVEEPAEVAAERVVEEPAEVAGERAEVAEESVEVAAERAEVAKEPAEVAAERAEVAGKPAKHPKPKVPATPPKKPSAQKPPPAKVPPAKVPPAKVPPAKTARPAKPARLVKSARPAKPVPVAKRVPSAKPAQAATRPKPSSPTRSKPPASKKPRVERKPSSEQPPPVVPDEGREKMLTCSIYWWRDGPVADFYALATGLQGRAWVVERSPRFEWVAGDFPAEAREAHAALVEALVMAGWRHAGSEGVWYRQRFERPVALDGP